MKMAGYFVMVLLATAIANAAPTTVHEAVSGSIRTRLGRGLGGVLPRGGDVWTSEGRMVVAEEGKTNTMRGVIDEESNIHTEKVVNACMTREQCNKKKVVCSKKCTDLTGSEVGEVHSSAAKCRVNCKKCVPDC